MTIKCLFKTAFAFLSAMLLGCSTADLKEDTTMTHDPHSYAIPSEARVTHLQWDAKVDFDKKVITATATWGFDKQPGASEIIFDTKGLDITSVVLDNGQPATFRLSAEDPLLGQKLVVEIGSDTRSVSITYTTSPDAEALQWLNPQQTAGKKFPFLFTQSQAILARSWIPCQDSPGIKFTYSSTVTVPNDLLALMSASNPQARNATGVYNFEMKQPISSYLLALAVGDIAFRPVSDRSGVYAEPSIADTAAWEFADLEKMIAGAEELYGPYRWERYDVIVLPPSFPFGGMENPRLTFATPTILAGDRSLTSLVAHELAHSWSGNLVTNATWNDFWLNEGFTVYFETRIMEKLYGRAYAEMLASLNLQDLKDEVQSMNEAQLAGDTRLLLDLEGRNPDDGVTDIAYNKGYFFLRSIEETHGREKFDQFLNDYFSENAFKAMTTKGFRNYIRSYYKNNFDIDLNNSHLDAWILTEGLPANVPTPDAERFRQVDSVLADWLSERAIDNQTFASWSTHEWLHFLRKLPKQLRTRQMESLDALGHFSESGNAEIITAWGVIAIRNSYKPMYPRVETFLVNTGRRKFLSPLYNEMIKTEAGKTWAMEVYRKARPNYHFVATNTFDKLLTWQR